MQHLPSMYIDIATVRFQFYGTYEIVIGLLEHFEINQSLSKAVWITELVRTEVIHFNKKSNDIKY